MDKIINPIQLFELLDKFSEGIILTDDEGTILFCNEVAVSNYEISKYVLEGSSIEILLENQLVDQSFNRLAATTGKPVTYEQVCRSKRRLLNKTTPVFDSKGNLEFIIEQTYSIDELAFESGKEFDESLVTAQHAAPQPNTAQDHLLAEFNSKEMMQVYALADNMAPKNINILLLGPSGTGKSSLAKRIHNNSTRRDGPFVTINCSTIPENLLESELFGYMKGAFSGANERGKQGLVSLADGGTLFLDEIGEIPLSLQAKMLQLVQDKTYLPVGGIHPQQVDTRIIAATNKNVLSQVEKGLFREDLYYRLAVITISLPALAGRTDDIELLVRHFTHVFNHRHGTDVVFSNQAMQMLLNYTWPGNIRELEHLLEYLILNAEGGYITPELLPEHVTKEYAQEGTSLDKAASPAPKVASDAPQSIISDTCTDVNSYDEYMSSCENRLINELYLEYNNSYKLADRLKISQSKASRLIRKYVKNQ